MTPLAVNIEFYNGFLAAGLIWGLLAKREDVAIKVFFLVRVITAGSYGAITIQLSILLFQAIPAVLALLLVGLEHCRSEDVRVVRN